MKLVSQSLNIFNLKNNFPLYHIRCALDLLSSIISSEKRNNPKISCETQNIDFYLNNILKEYNSLPVKSELCEEINVVLTKSLEDTGRSLEKNDSSIFSGF